MALLSAIAGNGNRSDLGIGLRGRSGAGESVYRAKRTKKGTNAPRAIWERLPSCLRVKQGARQGSQSSIGIPDTRGMNYHQHLQYRNPRQCRRLACYTNVKKTRELRAFSAIEVVSG